MKPDFKKILSDSLRMTIDIATEAVGNNSDYFKTVLDLSLKSKSPLNMRASRVVVFVVDKNPELFIPYVNKIAKLFPDFKNEGLKRGFAYVLSKYTTYLNEENQVEMIDVCFKYMLLNEKVAVKYNCLKFLFEMTKMYPDFKGELQAAIDFNITEKIFRMNGEIKKIYKKIDK